MTPAIWEPASASEAAALLERARRAGLVVAPRGAGTKLSWMDRGDRLDAWISTARLTEAIEHDAGDMVATLPAGVPLAEANRVLASRGQWLPLDPGHGDRATIGGILAANDSGPRRHRHGAPRDLVLGVEAAFADGRVARAGGRVVKNVAGYDLSRLLCGSLGQLAVITAATFKLAPLAAVSRTVVGDFPTGQRAAEAALALAATHLTPSALELAAPSPRLLVRFETSERAATQMAAETGTLLAAAGAQTRILADGDEYAAWDSHDEAIWRANGTIAKLSVLPAEIGRVLEAITATADQLEWSLAGRAALGVMYLRIGGPVAAQSTALQAIAAAIAGRNGLVAFLQGPDEVLGPLARYDRALGDTHLLMRQVKSAFDPSGVLASMAALRPEPSAP